MRRTLALCGLLAALVLGSCASMTPPRTSWIASVDPHDADQLAGGITAFLEQRLPAASTTLVLEPPPADQASNALTPALHQAVRQAGFAVAETDTAPPEAQRLRYLVGPLDAGLLVRIQVAETEASRLYVRNGSGALQPASPFTVREAE